MQITCESKGALALRVRMTSHIRLSGTQHILQCNQEELPHVGSVAKTQSWAMFSPFEQLLLHSRCRLKRSPNSARLQTSSYRDNLRSAILAWSKVICHPSHTAVLSTWTMTWPRTGAPGEDMLSEWARSPVSYALVPFRYAVRVWKFL